MRLQQEGYSKQITNLLDDLNKLNSFYYLMHSYLTNIMLMICMCFLMAVAFTGSFLLHVYLFLLCKESFFDSYMILIVYTFCVSVGHKKEILFENVLNELIFYLKNPNKYI